MGCPCRLATVLQYRRSDDLNLGEVFQTMSRKDHTRVWTSVLKAVAPIVDEGRFLAHEEEVCYNTLSKCLFGCATLADTHWEYRGLVVTSISPQHFGPPHKMALKD